VVQSWIASICGDRQRLPPWPQALDFRLGSFDGLQVARWSRRPVPSCAMIVAAGGGAGMPAVFNAPIAGFFYTIEETAQRSRPV